MKFDIGETVILSVGVRDEREILKDPATSMRIVIDRISPVGQNIIASTAMIKDATGGYHYDYDSAGALAGTYVAKYTAVNGTRITIEKYTFTLE